jgi:hypothetical protein
VTPGLLSGVFRFRGKSIDVRQVKANGDSLTFLVPIHPSGKIDGDTLVFELKMKDGKLVGTMREKKTPPRPDHGRDLVSETVSQDMRLCCSGHADSP